MAPGDIAAQYRLAEHYEDIRDWDKAQRIYLIILSIKPEEGKAHKQIALIYERDERYGLALYHWQKYAEINPTDQDAIQHIQAIRKPLLSKKQIDQLAAEQKLKEVSQQATPTSSIPVIGAPANGSELNSSDSNPGASATVPTVTDNSSTQGQPAVVMPADSGNSNAPAPSSAPPSAPSSGLVPVGDIATTTPSQGNDIPSLPK